jgi:hypothetical protein
MKTQQTPIEPLPASDLFGRGTEPPAWLQFAMIWVNGIIGGFGIRGIIECDLLLMASLPLGIAGGWLWVQKVKDRMSRPNIKDQATASKRP